jgi:amino acid transporter
VATAQVEERQLLKAMSWWDGFVVALANPGFLIASLGLSIGALGTTGAFVLWTISICLGALQNNIHAELACMFPNKSGGVALYAHEAWRKYLTLIGPLATFGYWIGWSVVLSVNGLVAGTLIQAEFFSSSDWSTSGAGFDLTLPIVLGAALIIVVWAFNVFGVRPAVWFGYVTGGLLCIPAFVLMFLPYVTGDWSSSNMTWEIGGNGGLALVLCWLYIMCWSAYGIEVVATFAPEFRDTERDTPKALRTSALFCAGVYALLPLGLGGTLGTATVADDATGIAFYTGAFDAIVGSTLGKVMILCVVGGLVLSMNTATMDGSRALFGIAKDGMTIRQFGALNRYHVPALAMTVDAILNLFLITYFQSPLEILAVSNVGYVFATCAALSAFVLLRRDRPNWPRPVRLPNWYVPLGVVLAAINFILLLFGGFIYSGGFLGITGYGYGWDKTRTGLLVLVAAFLLYVYRHVVQDKIPLRLREDVPRTPEEEEAHPEFRVAPDAVPSAHA